MTTYYYSDKLLSDVDLDTKVWISDRTILVDKNRKAWVSLYQSTETYYSSLSNVCIKLIESNNSICCYIGFDNINLRFKIIEDLEIDLNILVPVIKIIDSNKEISDDGKVPYRFLETDQEKQCRESKEQEELEKAKLKQQLKLLQDIRKQELIDEQPNDKLACNLELYEYGYVSVFDVVKEKYTYTRFDSIFIKNNAIVYPNSGGTHTIFIMQNEYGFNIIIPKNHVFEEEYTYYCTMECTKITLVSEEVDTQEEQTQEQAPDPKPEPEPEPKANIAPSYLFSDMTIGKWGWVDQIATFVTADMKLFVANNAVCHTYSLDNTQIYISHTKEGYQAYFDTKRAKWYISNLDDIKAKTTKIDTVLYTPDELVPMDNVWPDSGSDSDLEEVIAFGDSDPEMMEDFSDLDYDDDINKTTKLINWADVLNLENPKHKEITELEALQQQVDNLIAPKVPCLPPPPLPNSVLQDIRNQVTKPEVKPEIQEIQEIPELVISRAVIRNSKRYNVLLVD